VLLVIPKPLFYHPINFLVVCCHLEGTMISFSEKVKDIFRNDIAKVL
jgi:hypothetical protein